MTTTVENFNPHQPDEDPNVNFTPAPFDPEKQPDKKKIGPIKKLIAGIALLGAVGGGAAVAFGGSGNSPEGGRSVPSTSAPANPRETTTTAPEKATAATLKIHLGNETVVGIDNFRAKYGTFRDNVPDAPAVSTDEGHQVWSQYLNTLQAATNLEVAPADKALEQQLVQELLFVPGATGELPDFVNYLEEAGGKITNIKDTGLLGPPEANYLIQGTAIAEVSYPDGTVKTFNITAATQNDFGAIHAIDHVSTLNELK